MRTDQPIERAIAALEAQFEAAGLPRLHRDQFESLALATLRCWAVPTEAMIIAADEVEDQVLTASYPDSDGHFQDGGVEKLWQTMLVAANNEVVEQRG